MFTKSIFKDKIDLPDSVKGRSIYKKVIPTDCPLESLLDKMIGFYRDETKLKPKMIECYNSYNIKEIKGEILKSDLIACKRVIRNHILESPIDSFGNHIMDIYLVGYVCEKLGEGKETFFNFLVENNITEKKNSMEAIWNVGLGDGIFLGILNDNGSIKDWEFIEGLVFHKKSSGNSHGVPTLEEAVIILKEAERLNPGEWVDHSIVTADAAELIANEIPGMDGEKARVLGLLHDIGRRVGRVYARHTLDGYNYLMEKGYPVAAKISLTHGFLLKDIEDTCGGWDGTEEEYQFAKDFIENSVYDDYDKLIQLCDAIALPEGFCLLEQRLVDVVRRYGFTDFTQDKWEKTFEIKEYFETKIGKSIYELLPEVKDNIFRF